MLLDVNAGSVDFSNIAGVESVNFITGKRLCHDKLYLASHRVGGGVIVPAQNSSHIRIAQQNRDDLFLVPQQAAFFVGGFFEEMAVAEDDDGFFVFQYEVKHL